MYKKAKGRWREDRGQGERRQEKDPEGLQIGKEKAKLSPFFPTAINL